MTTTDDITLQDLHEAARIATSNEGVPGQAHKIIQDIRKAQIIVEAKKSYRNTGEYLPKRFKRQLAEKYHFSQKQIEHIVYDEVQAKGTDSQLDIFAQRNRID